MHDKLDVSLWLSFLIARTVISRTCSTDRTQNQKLELLAPTLLAKVRLLIKLICKMAVIRTEQDSVSIGSPTEIKRYSLQMTLEAMTDHLDPVWTRELTIGVRTSRISIQSTLSKSVLLVATYRTAVSLSHTGNLAAVKGPEN